MSSELTIDTCIQDPAWPDSIYLLDEILASSHGATAGGGAFAFASESGVKLLFHDLDFQRFLAEFPFHLVIGVDAITDTKAIDAIAACVDENRNFSAQVFWGNIPGAIFHPKLCWFSGKQRVRALVGSGNLTPGGLRGNCEAFSIAELTSAQFADWEKRWNSWLAFHRSQLLPLDDSRVLKQAARNAIANARAPKTRNDVLVDEDDGRISVGPSRHGSDAVLVAEIPRGGSRWSQANFNLATFRGFFGASPATIQRIILTHVDRDGSLGHQEVRPSVSVESNNHRFELEAASGLAYPTHGRPIAVFVRVATRTFRYRLIMPGGAAHRQASAYLARYAPQAGGRMRRFVSSVSDMRSQPFFRNLAS